MLTDPHFTSAKKTFYRILPDQVIQGALQALYLSISVIVITQVLGGNDWETAAVQSSMMVGLLFSLLYIQWGQKHSPVILTVAPRLFAQILIILIIIATKSAVFTIIVCLASFFNAISVPLLGVIYQRKYHQSIRGRITAFTKQWHLLASVFIAWSIGHTMETSPNSYRWIYPLVGVFGICASIWLAGIHCPPEEQQNHIRFREIPKVLFQDRSFVIFMVLQFIMGVANLAGIAIFHLYVNKKEYLGCSPQQAAFFTGVCTPAAMLFTIWIWGKIFDSLDILKLRAITSIVMAMSYICYVISDSLWATGAGAIIFGIGRGGGNLVWLLGVLAFATREKAPLYLGIHTCLTGVRGTFSPFLGVWLLQQGWHPRECFLVIAIVIIITAILTLVLIPVPKIHENDQQN